MLKIAASAILIALLVQSPLTRLDTRASISYSIEDGKGVPGYRDSDRELAKLAFSISQIPYYQCLAQRIMLAN